jgi:hypothetical protein
MSGHGPIERVIDLLSEAGYRRIDGQVSIASIPFEFDATLVGSGSLDLVLVVDLIGKKDPAIVRRQIEGMASALDLVQSRRSLTVVLLGPPPPLDVIHRLSKVARVLAVGSPVGPGADAELIDAVAVLLPLKINRNSSQLFESGLVARRELASRFDDEISRGLLDAAAEGANQVHDAMTTILEEPLAELGLE